MRPPVAEDTIDKRARRVMQPFSPAYFVIDARDEIIRFSGAETGHYLEPSPGAASLNLFGILRKDLRPAVRTAAAASTRRTAQRGAQEPERQDRRPAPAGHADRRTDQRAGVKRGCASSPSATATSVDRSSR